MNITYFKVGDLVTHKTNNRVKFVIFGIVDDNIHCRHLNNKGKVIRVAFDYTELKFITVPE